MLDFHELMYSLKQHKTRSAITCAGIIWGIFILILLLGLGNGFETGIFQLLGNFSRNSLWVIGGQSKPGNSYGMPKPVEFDTATLNLLKKKHKEIIYLSPEALVPNNLPVVCEDKVGYFTIKGVTSEYFEIKMLDFIRGRAFNKLDESEKLPYAIIGKRIAKTFFQKNDGVVGKYIVIGSEHFKIIGLLEDGTIFSQSEAGSILVPYSTFLERLNPDSFTNLALTWNENLSSDQMEEQVRATLSNFLDFDIEDENALFFFSLDKQVAVFGKLFQSVKVFIWFIGISLLISGMVGVANIMYISVRERTKEIGIRMAVGAKPKVVLKYILAESTFLTLIAGCTGVLLGVLVINTLNFLIDYLYGDEMIIKNLFIDPYAVFGAFLALVIAGVVAGMIPARKAANIVPVEALRFE